MTPEERTRVNQERWNAQSADYQQEHHSDLEDDLLWGPSMPPEKTLGVLGEVSGKDILELCCGGGQSLAYLVRRGARVVGVDFSAQQLEYARTHLAKKGTAAQLVLGNVEDLSALGTERFDVAFSAYAFAYVERIDRVFRETWRALRPGGLFAFSCGSPFLAKLKRPFSNEIVVEGRYFDRTLWVGKDEWGTAVEFHRTYGDWLSALMNAGFVVTDLLEPEPLLTENTWRDDPPLSVLEKVPATTIWRAEKPAQSGGRL